MKRVLCKKLVIMLIMLILLMNMTACMTSTDSDLSDDNQGDGTDEEGLSPLGLSASTWDPYLGYPQIFQAWSEAENLPYASKVESMALHDLVFHDPYIMDVRWNTSEDQPYEFLATDLVDLYTGVSDLSSAKALKADILAMNPNFKILSEVNLREVDYVSSKDIDKDTSYWDMGSLPEKSPLWLRDDQGQLIPSWGEDTNANGYVEANEATACLIDFTDSSVQDIIIKKTIALYETGVFDGVFFDWWSEVNQTLVSLDYSESYIPLDVEVEARINILQSIRQAVGDDFLILVNTNFDQVPKSAEYINGIYMECFKTWDVDGYDTEAMRQIEETLIWAEENCQTPVINCLEGWRNTTEYDGDQESRIIERNSDDNLSWMRAFTTLSLTHSDGYVLFSDANEMPSPDHLHNYYDFWMVNIGNPVDSRLLTYNNLEQVYYRKFSEGMVIYNGSDQPVEVVLNSQMESVAIGEMVEYTIIMPMDGDIFLNNRN